MAKTQNKKPSLLYWDIETSPNIVTTWGLWINGPISHDNILQERYIICGSWKYSGDRKVYSSAIDCKDPTDDKQVVIDLHAAVSSADAVVHHHGDAFDIKWLNTRAVYYGLPPLPNVIQIDTKKIAKKKFRFNNNKLDYLAQYLGIGKKIKTEFGLWKRCMQGDSAALNRMVGYNKRDVRLLEKVYHKLAPYVPAQLNHALFTDRAVCKGCGSDKTQYRGSYFTAQKKYRRYQCNSCGQWGHSK